MGLVETRNFLLRGLGWQRKALATKISNYGLVFSGDFFSKKFILEAREVVTLREKPKPCRPLFAAFNGSLPAFFAGCRQFRQQRCCGLQKGGADHIVLNQ